MCCIQKSAFLVDRKCLKIVCGGGVESDFFLSTLAIALTWHWPWPSRTKRGDTITITNIIYN